MQWRVGGDRGLALGRAGSLCCSRPCEPRAAACPRVASGLAGVAAGDHQPGCFRRRDAALCRVGLVHDRGLRPDGAPRTGAVFLVGFLFCQWVHGPLGTLFLTFLGDLVGGQGTLRGHTDMVHCVAAYPVTPGRCATASEDGTVRLWDCRASQTAAQTLTPPRPAAASTKSSPRLPWMACVDVDPGENFVVCGGGASLALWHTRGPTLVRSLASTSADGHAIHPQFVRFDGSQVGVLSVYRLALGERH